MTRDEQQQCDPVPPRRSDRGVTFIELLVSIVLIGTVGIGVLAAMRATVIGTRIERDHSKAYQWLQSATSVLQGLPDSDRRDCTTPDLPSYYEAKIQGITPPYGWNAPAQISVRNPVLFESADGTGFGVDCAESASFTLQLVTIEVRSPAGDIIEELEVIVRGS